MIIYRHQYKALFIYIIVFYMPYAQLEWIFMYDSKTYVALIFLPIIIHMLNRYAKQQYPFAYHIMIW